MCLLALAVDPHPSLRFVLAANRDEAFERPTREAHFWDDAPDVLAGRDLRAGGTWLGVTRAGRLAAITNVRDPAARREGRSRGEIPRGFLVGSHPAASFADDLRGRARDYPSFNVFAGDADGCFYVNERDEGSVPLGQGVHVVSNGRLGDPWPKVGKARFVLGTAVSGDGAVDVEALFRLLSDDRQAPDEELPSTGVPLEIERMLSPLFIRGAAYGTRCSTVVVMYRNGRIGFEERSFGPNAMPLGTVSVNL
ncbi:MAG: NRDE family protein [Polyangiaceae bacterium]|nr:NRDE family protein [Polyangiaceae bacterium]